MSRVSFSVSLNLKRRHLENGQRAAVGAKVEPLFAAQAAKRVGGAPEGNTNASKQPVANRPQVESIRSAERSRPECVVW